MKLVAGQTIYPMPEVGRPYSWTIDGKPYYRLLEISPALMDEQAQVPAGYPSCWCDRRDGTFEIYPAAHFDAQLIIRPLPDPLKLAAFIAQEIGQ